MLQITPFQWISQYYFGFFFVFGVYLPFWTLWLESQSIDAREIGMILGLGFTVRFLANLTITPRCNRAEHLIPALRIITLVALVTLLALQFGGEHFWLIVLGTAIFNLCCGPIVPLSDSVANFYAKHHRLDYGKARVWGSISFIVASTLVGWCVAHFGRDIILLLAIAGTGVLLLLSLRQANPMPTSEKSTTTSRMALHKVLFERPYAIFILLTTLIQGSHAAYYSFSSIYWKSVGYGEEVIGYLWSIGVIAEVVIFAISGRFFARWPLQRMFTLAAVAVVVRWGLTATSTNLMALISIQVLHSVTFALAHIAAIRYIQQAPSDKMVALQSLYNAIALGGSVALLSGLSGWGYSHWGAGVFWCMAVLGGIALFVRLPKTEASC